MLLKLTALGALGYVGYQYYQKNFKHEGRAAFAAYLDAIAEGRTPEKTLEQLIADFAEADAKYEFTLASVSQARKFTPEEREARSIARDYLKQELDKMGRKIGDVPEGMDEQAWKDAIEAEIDRIADTPEVKKMAKDIIKTRAKTSTLQVGGFNFGGEPAPVEAAQ